MQPFGKKMREEYYYGYREIGKALGVHEKTLRVWCKEAKVRLPRWTDGKTGSVYLPREQIKSFMEALLRVKGPQHVDTIWRLAVKLCSTTQGKPRPNSA